MSWTLSCSTSRRSAAHERGSKRSHTCSSSSSRSSRKKQPPAWRWMAVAAAACRRRPWRSCVLQHMQPGSVRSSSGRGSGR
jgi:hypothetical protein